MNDALVHLTFVTHRDRPGLLLWHARSADVPAALRQPFTRGQRLQGVPMVLPKSRRRTSKTHKLTFSTVDGWWLPAAGCVTALASLPMNDVAKLPPSVAVWTLASKWVLEAVARHQLVPGLEPAAVAASDTGPEGAEPEGAEPKVQWRSTWRVAPVRREDRARLAGLAASMPGVARAWVTEPPGEPINALDSGAVGSLKVASAPWALHAFMDAGADGVMRAPSEETTPRPANGPRWVMRLGQSLAGPGPGFELDGLSERHLPDQLAQWVAPATSMAGGGRPIVGFRLEEPDAAGAPWVVSYHLLSPADDGRVSVEAMRAGTSDAKELLPKLTHPQETLLEALGRCARIFDPIARSLSEAMPIGVKLSATEAWDFLTKASLMLERGGYQIEVPAALTKVGRRRVRARMRVGAPQADAMSRSSLLAGMVRFKWEACLGEDTLTEAEFRQLAKANAPLVLHRGRWIAVDPGDVERLQTLIDSGGGTLESAEALRLALAGEVPVPEAPGQNADVVGIGTVARALEVLKGGGHVAATEEAWEPPSGLEATLRPYQQRGLAWLGSVTSTGFGACLADDMGLGKTVQVLSLMQYLSEDDDELRFLVVCPTSVIGNWKREINRFTPDLHVVIHHGPSRASSLRELMRRMDAGGRDRPAVVITSYALVRGDESILGRHTWDMVTLDEAQNIKNPGAAQSQAARRLVARRRVALTGTPVENRLTELWSIMDFLNAGLLGTQTHFKKAFAVPIERYGDPESAERLRRVTAPFILRRLKTDPTIAPELPDKFETVRYCPLTREQASLYQAAIDNGMNDIAGMEQGMQRRGRILAMITQLKQVCNHPTHFLKDGTPKPKRSGKMTRFLELMAEVQDSEGAALVFTQYREMGEILKGALERALRSDIFFFHGGLARTARERMVAAFQEPSGPPVMVVSLKAGGTGLNLTRANHVFHYDRWWNPAVEDQATDRAFRIGQTRDVTVHRLVCQGTLEEQIHRVLEEKRQLADRVIGTDETWLSELDDDMLHELVRLGSDAVLEED